MNYSINLKEAVELALPQLVEYEFPTKHVNAIRSAFLPTLTLYGVEKETGKRIVARFCQQVACLEHECFVLRQIYSRESGSNYAIAPVFRLLCESTLGVLIYDEPGENLLTKWYEVPKGPTILQFFDFAFAACKTLDFIHKHGFVHGEIRQDTFHLSQNGSYNAKLLGFGSSLVSVHFSIQCLDWQKFRRVENIRQKLQFLTPEQASESGDPLTARNDIYCLGVLFYIFLSRCYPWSGSPMRIIQCILSKPFPSVITKRPEIPFQVDLLIQKMTCKSEDERFASAAEVYDALLKVQRSILEAQSRRSFYAAIRFESLMYRFFPKPFRLSNTLYGHRSEYATLIELVTAYSLRQTTTINASRSKRDLLTRSTKYRTPSTDALYSQVVTVTGGKGSGKSYLLQSVSIECRKLGYFFMTSYKPTTSTPWETLCACMSSIIRQILCEIDSIVREYFTFLWDQVGYELLHLKEFFDMIPELSYVLDPKYNMHITEHQLPNVHSRDISDFGQCSGRMSTVTIVSEIFRSFTYFRPTIIIFDDVHYASFSSLAIMKTLISTKIPSFFVFSWNPTKFSKAKQKFYITKCPFSMLTSINVSNFSKDAIFSYVKDTLQRPPQVLEPLVTLLLEKTNGSPILISLMLRCLYHANYFVLDGDTTSWVYDINKVTRFLNKIGTYSLTKLNMMELHQYMSSKPLNLLLWASVLAQPFSYTVLEKLTKPLGVFIPAEVMLMEAKNVLVHVSDDYYGFLHNEQHHVLYGQISETEKKKMHSYIAEQLVVHRIVPDDRSSAVTYILRAEADIKLSPNAHLYVDYLLNVAEMVIRIGSNEFACEILRAALFILPEDPWNNERYDNLTVLRLYLLAAYCNWFIGDDDEAKLLLNSILANVNDFSLTFPVYELYLKLAMTSGDSVTALSIAMIGLSYSEMPDLTAEILETRVDELFDEVADYVLQHDLDNFTKPEPNDASYKAFISLLCLLAPLTYNISQRLHYYLGFQIVKEFIKTQSRNLRSSLVFVACYSILKGKRPQVLDKVMNLLHPDEFRLAPSNMETHVFLLYNALPNRMDDYSATGNFMRRLDDCMLKGNGLYSVYCFVRLFTARLFNGENAHQLLSDQENAENWTTLWNVPSCSEYLPFCRNVIMALLGLTDNENPKSLLTFDGYDQSIFNLSSRNKPTVEYLWCSRIFLCLAFLYGHYETVVEVGLQYLAVTHRRILDTHFVSTRSLIAISVLELLRTLDLTPEKRKYYLNIVLELQVQISFWTKNYHILGVVSWIHIIKALYHEFNDDIELSWYEVEESLGTVEVMSSVLDRAIVFCCAGRFYYTHHSPFLGRAHVLRACSLFRQMGYFGVEKHLAKQFLGSETYLGKRTFPVGVQTTQVQYESGPNRFSRRGSLKIGYDAVVQSFDKALPSSDDHVLGRQSNSSGSLLDEGMLSMKSENLNIMALMSVIECAQSLSGELQLPALLKQVIRFICENSVVTNVSVICCCSSTFSVVARGDEKEQKVYEPYLRVEDSDVTIPPQLLARVLHDCTIMTLYESSCLEESVTEQWLKQKKRTDSFTLIPLSCNQQVLGILFLRLPRHTFRGANQTFLKLLSQQIAISVSNALLYQKLRKTITDNVTLIEIQKNSYKKYKQLAIQYKTILDAVPSIVWMMDDTTGDIEYMNINAQKFLGVSGGDHSSVSMLKFIHPDYQETWRALLQSQDKLQKQGIEVPFLKCTGGYYWYLCRGLPMESVVQNQKKWIIVCFDITAEKEAQDAAFRAMKLKANFLANMSHELRTPFSGFYGMLSLLSETKLDEEQRDIVSTARQSCDSLLHIINDLLNFSELESGKMKIEPDKVFDVEESIADCIELVYPTTSRKHVQISYDIMPNVPSLLAGDCAKLRQVITNLLGNAAKFTMHGHILLRCSILPEDDTKYSCKLKVEVEDTGIGLTEEEMKLLFQPFTQVDGSTTRIYGGSGLGLSICRQICKIMNGDIGVESAVNEGSTFWFYVELRKVTAESAQEHLNIKTSMFERLVNLLQDKRVLILRSFYTARSIFNAMFAKASVSYVSCTNAFKAEVLDAINKSRGFDFLCFEIQGNESLELLQTILSVTKANELIIIVLLPLSKSTKDATFLEQFDRLLRQNSNKLIALTKPVRISKLIKSLSKLLSRPQHCESLKNWRPPSSSHINVDLGRLTEEETSALRKVRVLIAEDNIIAQKLLKKQLNGFGLSVDIASDGLELIQMFKDKPSGYYKLIFADRHMPKCDGVEAVKNIRHYEKEHMDNSHIPIVALTADIQKSAREKCLQAGMDVYITKPFFRNELIDVLRKYIL
ncbi:HisK/Mak2 protein kinase Mak2 [Schizosaccharomyces japonicus yFS275]|uniref:histidine kinase n=1 Tax=Schizosaccharomyces japonicus (strain yFS275 / FY16936) TaxID=402676 RepID=B6K1S1_SCHJY|nr:HisK/Mak2 protein kinase Mak2 [Schizosaccharomyces japonicus yFS275]EEB07102.1 HisK/Mak2 protein kinase Mak2 [Schizosaccharomyces japonicus yFS275]